MKLIYLGRGGYKYLVSEIVRMAENFKEDIRDYAALKPGDFYDVIRKIPYVKETQETLKRPAVLFRDGGDCDDKTIAFLSYAFVKGIPARVYLAGRKDKQDYYGHVFPAFQIAGKWYYFDATYEWNELNKLMDCWNKFTVFWG